MLPPLHELFFSISSKKSYVRQYTCKQSDIPSNLLIFLCVAVYLQTDIHSNLLIFLCAAVYLQTDIHFTC